jgi:hypothetical protein
MQTSGLLVLATTELHVQKNDGRESYLWAGAGENDLVVEHITQPSIWEVMGSNIHYKCLYLAEEAPVCWGCLRNKLSYKAVL